MCGEDKLGIQLVLNNKFGFNDNIGTYYRTLSRMRADYEFADIVPFYPMYMLYTPRNALYPCTIVNIDVDKIDTESGNPTEIRIGAEIPNVVKPYFVLELGEDILSAYYHVGLMIRQCDAHGGRNLSEYEVRSCMVDV